MTALLVAPWTHAETTEDEPFFGELTFGLVATSGNTESLSTNGKIEGLYETRRWRQQGAFQGWFAEEDDRTTAERYLFTAKTDYKFTEHDYLFLALRYDRDRFSGFRYRASQTAGYGRRLLYTERQTLDAELGGGASQSRTDDSERSRDTIVRGAIAYILRFGESARFTQDLLAESGRDSTMIESETALRSNLVGNLSMKASYLIRRHSQVPPDRANTDTFTSIALTYTF